MCSSAWRKRFPAPTGSIISSYAKSLRRSCRAGRSVRWKRILAGERIVVDVVKLAEAAPELASVQTFAFEAELAGQSQACSVRSNNSKTDSFEAHLPDRCAQCG